MILVHLLEASGTKYIQGFFSSLPPTKKLPRDMSHETEYFSFIHLLSSHNGSQSLLINSLTLYLESKKICFRILKYCHWRSQDGGGVGRGEHFLPHKFIKRAFKRRVNSTKQLLNAGRGHQATRKAAQLFKRR